LPEIVSRGELGLRWQASHFSYSNHANYQPRNFRDVTITTVLALILLRKSFEKEPPEKAPTKAEAEDTTAPDYYQRIRFRLCCLHRKVK
jgi:hypothetical protein